MQSKKNLFLVFVDFDIIISGSMLLLILLFVPSTFFSKTFAASPAFDEVLIPDKQMGNQTDDWVQTYGDGIIHLRSDHSNLLTVNYFSDGKTLDATSWLASNSENASICSQPLKHIRHGILIAIVTLPENSGYNGAN
ncbi:hypothetical protein [Candidatus Nitrosocosmicus arcticus]|uniref:hypothetical protein n=1 Tax=Candidatus Nitrosocosmicus arcticus TaxID=2035267 RepID=UPI001648C930|nr:hypothetical protein [Candidatus Nitrosocosmicus arcticus]